MKEIRLRRFVDLCSGVAFIVIGLAEVVYYERYASGFFDGFPLWATIITPLVLFSPSILVRVFDKIHRR
jgi:hypothetical protein